MADQFSPHTSARMRRLSASSSRTLSSLNSPPSTCLMVSTPKKPPVAIAAKSWRNWAAKVVAFCSGTRDQAREQVGGQDADILGEEAEEQPDQEVGDGGGRMIVPPQGLGDAGEVGRGLLGDLGGGDGRAQRLRVGEGFAQQIELGRLQQVVEGEFIGDPDGVGEVGVDAKALAVADDQERRVAERAAVEQQLAVGFVQVGVVAFVLPGEVVALPDVGVALSAGRLGRARLEGVPGARRIGFGRRGMVEQPAEVDEMFLRHRALVQLDGTPFGDEGLGGEGCWHGGYDTAIFAWPQGGGGFWRWYCLLNLSFKASGRECCRICDLCVPFATFGKCGRARISDVSSSYVALPVPGCANWPSATILRSNRLA